MVYHSSLPFFQTQRVNQLNWYFSSSFLKSYHQISWEFMKLLWFIKTDFRPVWNASLCSRSNSKYQLHILIPVPVQQNVLSNLSIINLERGSKCPKSGLTFCAFQFLPEIVQTDLGPVWLIQTDGDRSPVFFSSLFLSGEFFFYVFFFFFIVCSNLRR